MVAGSSNGSASSVKRRVAGKWRILKSSFLFFYEWFIFFIDFTDEFKSDSSFSDKDAAVFSYLELH